jgi:3-methyladenine DNA glycosylase AlkC
MAQGFSLADQLFNAETIGQLAAEQAAARPGFDRAGFEAAVLAGLPGRTLLARLEWIADCLEPHLPGDFPAMAAALEAAMPPPLDPALTDDDFGQFIHAVPGILAVRHGLEEHRERALDLLHAATRRFSMEFYIRPFLTRWPEETLARLALWAGDENYHVRRLVSEGTRPRLPWAGRLDLPPARTLPLLDQLRADGTRYVTRSVANHLNDLAKQEPDLVVARLALWRAEGGAAPKELDWITRHALRSLLKAGHPGALGLLGYSPEVPVTAALRLAPGAPRIGGVLEIEVRLRASSAVPLPVLVDYRLSFARPGGRRGEKVFKLRSGVIAPGEELVLRKRHRLKGDATTFTLHPGAHGVVVQVNGVDRAEAGFELAG